MKKAETFTFQYDNREDRIKLFINYASITNRIDFFITRSFILKLFEGIEQVLIAHYTNSPKKKRKAVEKSRPLKGESATDNSTLQLMKKEAILLERVNYNYSPNKGQVQITFGSFNEDLAQATLVIEQFEQVIKLMLQAVPFIEWGIAPNILDI